MYLFYRCLHCSAQQSGPLNSLSVLSILLLALVNEHSQASQVSFYLANQRSAVKCSSYMILKYSSCFLGFQILFNLCIPSYGFLWPSKTHLVCEPVRDQVGIFLRQQLILRVLYQASKHDKKPEWPSITLPCSSSPQSMTMTLIISFQTICQKLFMLAGIGPWVAMNTFFSPVYGLAT